jgi:hypothetical protein
MTKRTVPLLLALVLPACGGDDRSPAQPASTPSAFGVYTREVSKADIERTLANRNDSPGFEPAPPGPWRLTLAPGKGIDVIKVTDPAGMTIVMDGKLDGDELRMLAYSSPEKGVFCDQAIVATAKYSLDAGDGEVTLAPIEEECADRDSILTGTWKKG